MMRLLVRIELNVLQPGDRIVIPARQVYEDDKHIIVRHVSGVCPTSVF